MNTLIAKIPNYIYWHWSARGKFVFSNWASRPLSGRNWVGAAITQLITHSSSMYTSWSSISVGRITYIEIAASSTPKRTQSRSLRRRAEKSLCQIILVLLPKTNSEQANMLNLECTKFEKIFWHNVALLFSCGVLDCDLSLSNNSEQVMTGIWYIFQESERKLKKSHYFFHNVSLINVEVLQQNKMITKREKNIQLFIIKREKTTNDKT